MGGRQDKKARKLLREELRARLDREKVTIMPEVHTLKKAVANLKPCFEIFGLTFFKTRDVEAFYLTLKDWMGERPKRVARKKFWGWFEKLSTKPAEVVNQQEPQTDGQPAA